MRKTLNFGKIDFYGIGKKVNLVTVEIEYKTDKNGKKVFTASGDIWNSRQTDIVCGGQCLDTIKEFVNNPLFNEVFRLWKLYHLNDLHAECEHQEALGWGQKARETRYIYDFSLTPEISRKQREIKENILNQIKSKKIARATDEECFILSLDYFLKSATEELPEQYKNYYKPYKTHLITLGHTKESEHPEGLLCKPCPVCGYKYGTAWTYRAIPQKDEENIYKILNDEWEG